MFLPYGEFYIFQSGFFQILRNNGFLGVPQRKPSFHVEIPRFLLAHVGHFDPFAVPGRTVPVVIRPDVNALQFAKTRRRKNDEPIVVETLQDVAVGVVQPMGLKCDDKPNGSYKKTKKQSRR